MHKSTIRAIGYGKEKKVIKTSFKPKHYIIYILKSYLHLIFIREKKLILLNAYQWVNKLLHKMFTTNGSSAVHDKMFLLS